MTGNYSLMRRMHIGLLRSVVHLLPSDMGLWRIIEALPNPHPQRTRYTAKLRGFPVKLSFNPQTYLGKFFFYRGMYEDRNIAQLCKLLRPGMSFVDIGANVGLYSMIARHCVGASGRVLAIEPQCDLAAVVEENAGNNNFSNVQVVNMAAGDHAGEEKIYQMSHSNDGQATLNPLAGEKPIGTPETVRIDTLSNILDRCGFEKVDGMKIDVEGAEVTALRGFADWLAAKPPVFIMVECVDKHLQRFESTAAELLEMLQSFDYSLSYLHRHRWMPLERIDRDPPTPDILAIHRGK
jgi:FkbM family methyltransferase